MQAASRPAASFPPGLPHPGKENIRIVGRHGDVGSARVRIDKENPLPGLSTIGGAVNAPLLLRSEAVAHGCHEDDVGILRMNHDPAYPARPVESHVSPCLARIGRFVGAVADGQVLVVISEPDLTGPGPDDVGIGRRHGHLPDEGDFLVIEDREPGDAAVNGLVNAACRVSGVVDGGVAGNAGYGGDAVARGSDMAVFELVEDFGVDFLGAGLGPCQGDENQGENRQWIECQLPFVVVHPHLLSCSDQRQHPVACQESCGNIMENAGPVVLASLPKRWVPVRGQSLEYRPTDSTSERDGFSQSHAPAPRAPCTARVE